MRALIHCLYPWPLRQCNTFLPFSISLPPTFLLKFIKGLLKMLPDSIAESNPTLAAKLRHHLDDFGSTLNCRVQVSLVLLVDHIRSEETAQSMLWQARQFSREFDTLPSGVSPKAAAATTYKSRRTTKKMQFFPSPELCRISTPSSVLHPDHSPTPCCLPPTGVGKSHLPRTQEEGSATYAPLPASHRQICKALISYRSA